MATRWQQNYQVYRSYIKRIVLAYQKRQDVRSFIELLLSLSTITIFGLFAIKPTIVTIIDLNNQINEKKETARLLDKKIQTLIEAEEIFNQNSANLSLIEDAIPKNPKPESYMRQIEYLATKHSVSVSSMDVKNVPLIANDGSIELDDTTQNTKDNTTSVSPPNTSFTLEIILAGEFNNIRTFLTDFESMRRVMLLDIISMNVVDSKETANKINLSIVGILIYFK